MAFIGTPLDTRNTFQSLVGKRFSGDGSETEFTLDVAPSSVLDIEVFVGNVRQDPNSAYTLSGTTLTFTGAPPSGTNNIYVVHQAKSVGTIGIPDDTISARTLVTADSSADHVLIEDATDGELKKALIPSFDTDAAVVFNESGAAVDFRVEGDTDTHLLMVDGSGDKVGIGEDVPEAKLHVMTGDASVGPNAQADELVVEGSGHAGISILSGNDDKGNIYFGDSGDDDIGSITYHHDGNTMRFTTNASEAVRISNGGNVGINDTDPVAALQVNATGSERVIQATGNSQSNELIRWNNTNSTSTNHTISFFKRNGTTTGSIAHTNNSTSFNTSSDYRLKENQVTLSNGITRLKNLKPYRFNFKTDADKTVDGFFAHEVSSVVPEAITGDKDAMAVETRYTSDDVETQGDNPSKNIGDPKTYSSTVIEPQAIDQAKLVPLLTKALQEAITEIESLKARVTTLEE